MVRFPNQERTEDGSPRRSWHFLALSLRSSFESLRMSGKGVLRSFDRLRMSGWR
jgi:hypothetical protein